MSKILKIRIACVVINGDEILLLHRSSELALWEFPAGTMKFGEQPEQTAKRELLEETGMKAAFKGLFASNSCTWKSGNDDVHEVVVAYLFEAHDKKVDITKNVEPEHSEYKWIKINQLGKATDLALTVTCTLDDIKKNLI